MHSITYPVQSEVVASEGNNSNCPLNNTIDLYPSSPINNIDDIPLSRIYTNLEKDLAPSLSTKTTKKPDDAYTSEPPYIDERIGSLAQRRIDICKNLHINHWLQPPFLKPLQTMHPDEKFEGD